MKIVAAILAAGLALTGNANAQAFGSHQYCDQLADIGANTYDVKKDGYPMETVLTRIGGMLEGQKKEAAQGVIVAIYGDSSIRSRKHAYSTVYSACKQ